MDYEVLQDNIVDRLQTFFAAAVADNSMEIVRLPENTGEMTQAIPGKPKLTVIYAGSEYEKSSSTSAIAQNEDVFIQVLIESSALYGPSGIYILVSLIKKTLTGFKPAGCSKIQVSKHHTIGQPEATRANNMWQYNAVFTTRTMHVEHAEEEVVVLLKKLTFKDIPDGEFIVIEKPEPEEN